jgi:hypothetical protein
MRCTMADRELIAAIFLAGLFVEAADNLINALAATPREAGPPGGPQPLSLRTRSEREPYSWLIVPCRCSTGPKIC